MRFNRWLVGFALCIGLSAGSAHATVTEDTFLLHNTGDLVDLCSAAQADPMYTAAVNFCHGFTVGVFRVLHEEDMARKSRHMFCMPSQSPSRNEGIANFVQWAKADPARSALPPADAIATFLTQQFPCSRSR
jgi:Ssp1 endopeptidase immunity protein Rap1a